MHTLWHRWHIEQGPVQPCYTQSRRLLEALGMLEYQARARIARLHDTLQVCTPQQ